ncbi:MAG: polysaccharide deacetylase family protein [Paenibacillus dendritiformis]|uniref:polysaccharide deacetylase family protein n=1 Tax=Paenibacillus dendritiformis TaxID=130049 RepID=UPI00143D472C|nr:polysaccharide deacetylase family protein [Paenibacillus dendritiformis]MDU5143802.1 polysaccharide deacetylase family protein [Paenibacillus dendritiformis]NKI22633.1 ChbG/HpnK family deacetylase [Paenibacillus dendritiformis]NRF96619.1 ChbG/HpnK family deacetylase [Paenibacillus dendritiformis]
MTQRHIRTRLILNCDDFGQSPAANQAIIRLLEEDAVSSATIMPPAPAFAEAAEWCRRTGQRNVGLHLTLTSEFEGYRWSSLTGGPSLHDVSGYLHATVEAFERSAKAPDVKRELHAQFEAARQAGIDISHVDNHMGSLYGMATGRSFLPYILWCCSRWGLPFRLFRRIDKRDHLLASIPGAHQTLRRVAALADALGVPLPDYLLSHPYFIEEGETYDSFKRMLIGKLYELPEGIVETYIHPAVEDRFMAARIPSWEKRVWEYRLMLDDDFAYARRDAGVELTDYRYVRKTRKPVRLRGALRLLAMLLPEFRNGAR